MINICLHDLERAESESESESVLMLMTGFCEAIISSNAKIFDECNRVSVQRDLRWLEISKLRAEREAHDHALICILYSYEPINIAVIALGPALCTGNDTQGSNECCWHNQTIINTPPCESSPVRLIEMLGVEAYTLDVGREDLAKVPPL